MARPERQNPAGEDWHFVPGFRVPANTTSFLTDRKGPKAGDFHGIAFCQRPPHPVEHILKQLRGFVTRQTNS